MIVCWSVKGGSGTSTVAALVALAISSSRSSDRTFLLDLDGDQQPILGLSVNPTTGVRQWLLAGSEVPSSALGGLLIKVTEGLHLLPAGSSLTEQIDASQAKRLALALASRVVVVDAGVAHRDDDFTASLVSSAATSLLVIRPCYLAVRRAAALGVKASGIVLVEEPARVLDARDIEDVLETPVVATLRWDEGLARAIDAGRMVGRSFRSTRALDELAKSFVSAEVEVAS